jgi:NAD(P)H-dependent flavin oxidoreductase YrpB (nitropropane dioxygenase family)
MNSLPVLKIGDLEVSPPVIQGGMGVRVSRANLASAVASQGCVGVIAATGLGLFENYPGSDFEQINRIALRDEIKKARSLTNGILGVNILVAMSDYKGLVRAAVSEGIDVIISGAGLPMDLPMHLDGKDIKLIPVVSSVRALKVICKKWSRHFNRLPDAVIVEGAKAGGHLGYSYKSLLDNTAPRLEKTVVEVVNFANSFNPNIPVIAAGGIFNGADIRRFLELGASGVQMATRFVCTHECDAHDNFKQLYLAAKADDIAIIESPVGLPGKVINNSFVEKIKQGKTMPFKCNYRCLRTCDPKTAPYCIAKVLANAAAGKMDESFAFAGSNAYLCNEIIPVKSLIERLAEEFERSLSSASESSHMNVL